MGKKMCKLSNKEYMKKQKSNTDYYCKKCGRGANKMKKLCKGMERLTSKD